MKKNLLQVLVLLCTSTIISTVHAQNFHTLSPLWNLKPGERPYLTATFGTGQSDNLQRGMAYNPATGHILLVSRTTSPVLQGIYVLDAATGGDVAPFTLNTNGINNGGTFVLSKIAVADDGAIYAANFGSQPGTTNTIYRWADENATPTIAFAGNPGVAAPNTNNSWGTTLDVRGTGTGTQILLGCNGTIASILNTADGVNFTPTAIATDAAPADFELGAAFGIGDTFWGKNLNRPLRKFNFNLASGTAVTIDNYGTNFLPGTIKMAQMGIDSANNLLAVLDVSSNLFGTVIPSFPRVDNVRFYDISNPAIAPVLLDIQPFNYTNVNRFSAGAIDFGDGKLFALDCNNGIAAFTINTPAPSVPQLITPIVPQRILGGRDAYLSAAAYRVTSYQWQHNGADIPGATNAALKIVSAQVSNSGQYNLVMSNLNGSISSSAILTVYNPSDFPHLTLLWSYNIGNANPPLTSGASQTPFQRSIAYNALSNQVIYINRTAAGVAGMTLNVLNADTGAFLYRLRTDGITGGALGLVMMDIAEDGVIYAGNVQANASVSPGFKLYRWQSSDSNAIPTLAWSGEPASQSTAVRWGDSMDVRGNGTGTEIILDAWDKNFGSILTTADGTNFNNPAIGFFQEYFRGTIGRSLQFGQGTTNFWQKRTGDRLYLSGYDLVAQTSSFVTNYAFADSLGPVEINFASNLLAGINFSGVSTAPDTLELYEISEMGAPLFLGGVNFPTNEQPNSNFIGHTVFGGGKVFSVLGNNGILALAIDSGPLDPPNILVQPTNLRLLVGGSGSLNVSAANATGYQWHKESLNIPGATNNFLSFSNAQLPSAGAYHVVVSNMVGSVVSSNAVVTVESPTDHYQLTQIWSTVPGTQPYATTAGTGSPNERTIAFNSLSNQLYVVQKVSATDFSVFVVNPDTGELLYKLNTTGVFGNVPSLGGATGIALDSIGVAEDGAMYISNETPDGAGLANPDGIFRLYRWENSHPDTLPTQIFQGDPAGQSTSIRWGDVMSVRGSGTNTEIIFDANQGTFGAILRPVDSTMTTFTNSPFTNTSPSSPIGRSLQFSSSNTFWQKRSGLSLTLSSYDITNQTSAVLTNYQNFTTAVGPVALATDKNLLAGIRFAPTTATPDAVGLYEISDLQNPFLLATYNFPVNKQANANLIGQVIFTSNKVFAVDGNNGIVAFNLVAPTGPALTITRVGTDVQLSWPDGSYILQSATTLTPPIIWTEISTAGQTSAVENASTGAKFYQLNR